MMHCMISYYEIYLEVSHDIISLYMISCTECMISYIANVISYATSEHTCRSGPKSGRAGSWPLGRASALLLSQCCPLSNAARYCPLSAVTSVPIMIADSCPPVRRCCPRFGMQNRVGIRLLIDCIRESRSAGTILWHYDRARTRRQWLVVVVRRPPHGCRAMPAVLAPPCTILRACASRRPCIPIS